MSTVKLSAEVIEQLQSRWLLFLQGPVAFSAYSHSCEPPEQPCNEIQVPVHQQYRKCLCSLKLKELGLKLPSTWILV